MGFTPTTHEPCLYFKYDITELTFILRQVDDILIVNDTEEACDEIRDQIQQRMTNPLNVLGTVRNFNRVKIDQTRDFNHVHCQTYIEKIVSHHGWENVTSRPTPMKTDDKYQADI